MTVIRQEDFIASVAAALQYISYYHPADYITSLAKAYEIEASPAAKDAIAQILINSRMCAEGHRPICQDTGIVTAFLKIGMDVHFEGPADGSPLLDVQGMVDEGVRRAYLDPDNKLRASILADPAGKRTNTRDNTPAVVNVELVEGDKVDVTVDTYPGHVWKGEVESIAPVSGSEFSVLPAQNTSGNWVKVVQRIPVRIKVEREADDPVLRAGMSVVAEIDTGRKRTWHDLF